MSSNPLSFNTARIRKIKGFTQEEVAAKAGLSRVAYRNIETGLAQPVFRLFRILQMLWM